MPLGNLSGWHFLIILVVVLLIWGSTKLPALAESIGKSAKILRREIRSDDEGKADSAATDEPTSTTDQR